MKANIPGIEKDIDLVLWTEGAGIPPDAFEPVSNIYTKIVSLANEFKLGRMPREDEVADWQGQEWELYLENLPKTVEASQVRFSLLRTTLFYTYIYILSVCECVILCMYLPSTCWTSLVFFLATQ